MDGERENGSGHHGGLPLHPTQAASAEDEQRAGSDAKAAQYYGPDPHTSGAILEARRGARGSRAWDAFDDYLLLRSIRGSAPRDRGDSAHQESDESQRGRTRPHGADAVPVPPHSEHNRPDVARYLATPRTMADDIAESIRRSLRPPASSSPDPWPGYTASRAGTTTGRDSCDDVLTSALDSVRTACSAARARRFRHPPPPGTATEELDGDTEAGILPAPASASIESAENRGPRPDDPHIPPPPRPRRAAPWTSLEDMEAALQAHHHVLDALQRLEPLPPHATASSVDMPSAGLSSIRSPASTASPGQGRSDGGRRSSERAREGEALQPAQHTSRSRASLPSQGIRHEARRSEQRGPTPPPAVAPAKDAVDRPTCAPAPSQPAALKPKPPQGDSTSATERVVVPASPDKVSREGTRTGHSARRDGAVPEPAPADSTAAPGQLKVGKVEPPAAEQLARVYEAYAEWWEKRARGIRPSEIGARPSPPHKTAGQGRGPDLSSAHQRLHTLQREAESMRRAQQDAGAAPEAGVAWVRQWGANVPASSASVMLHPGATADAALGCAHGFGIAGTDAYWRAERGARAAAEDLARARAYVAVQCAGTGVGDGMGDHRRDVRQLAPEEETASVSGLSHTAHCGEAPAEGRGAATGLLLPGEDLLGRRASAPFVDVLRGGRTYHPRPEGLEQGRGAGAAGRDDESIASTQALFEAEDGEEEAAADAGGSSGGRPTGEAGTAGEGAGEWAGEEHPPSLPHHPQPRYTQPHERPTGEAGTAGEGAGEEKHPPPPPDRPQLPASRELHPSGRAHSIPPPLSPSPPPRCKYDAARGPPHAAARAAPPSKAPAASPISTPSPPASPALWGAATRHALHRGAYAYDPLWHTHWDAYLGAGAVYGPGEEPAGPSGSPPRTVLPRRVPPPENRDAQPASAPPAPAPDTGGLVARASLPQGGARDPDAPPLGADPVAHEFQRLSAARRRRRQLPPSARSHPPVTGARGKGPVSPAQRRQHDPEALHTARRQCLLARRGLREEADPSGAVRVVGAKPLGSSPASKGLARAQRAVGQSSPARPGVWPHPLPEPAFHCPMCAALLQEGKGTRNCVRCAEERYLWEELRLQQRVPADASRGGEALIVTDFGAVGDGHTDDTAAFQAALQAAAANGSNVFAPGRQYLIASGLSIPDTVTLEGTYRTVPSHPVGQGEKGPTTGSVIRATNGRGSSSGQPLISVGHDATIRGFTVIYPEQKGDAAPVPFPWTILLTGSNAAVQDMELLNCWNCINATRAARHYIARVQGQPINVGVFVDQTYDIGRVEDVHFNPWYSPAKLFMAHHLLHGRAFVFARTDWEYVWNTFAFGYAIGYHFIASEAGSCNGNFLGIGADMMANASVRVDAADPFGILITNGEFTSFVDPKFGHTAADSTQVVVSASNGGAVRFTNSAFWGPSNQIARVAGSGTVGFNGCTFSQWDAHKEDRPALSFGGSTSALVNGNDFQQPGGQVEFQSSVKKAVVVGNLFAGKQDIRNHGAKSVEISANAEDA